MQYSENLFYKLTFGFVHQIQGFIDALISVLNENIEFLGFNVSVWQLIGGAGVAVAVIALLVKFLI